MVSLRTILASSWKCSSIGRVLALCTQSPGFDPQHLINQACWCMPTIPALSSKGRRIRYSGLSSGTDPWLGHPVAHATMKPCPNTQQYLLALCGNYLLDASIWLPVRKGPCKASYWSLGWYKRQIFRCSQERKAALLSLGVSSLCIWT